jgi:hypothetical protein
VIGLTPPPNATQNDFTFDKKMLCHNFKFHAVQTGEEFMKIISFASYCSFKLNSGGKVTYLFV